jgi:UDP-glucose 4-epimerase
VCREVTGAGIGTELTGRRAGDPAVLVASSGKIAAELGWHATRDLRTMASDAWQFTRFTQARGQVRGQAQTGGPGGGVPPGPR